MDATIHRYAIDGTRGCVITPARDAHGGGTEGRPTAGPEAAPGHATHAPHLGFGIFDAWRLQSAPPNAESLKEGTIMNSFLFRILERLAYRQRLMGTVLLLHRTASPDPAVRE